MAGSFEPQTVPKRQVSSNDNDKIGSLYGLGIELFRCQKSFKGNV
jgi:hypothetical protein